MKTRLDVTVLDLIREKQGLTSDKQLAEKLGVSASPVVFGSTVKARYPNSGIHQDALNAHNLHVKTQPAEIRDFLDFYDAVSPDGTITPADAADAAHLSTSGYQKLATAFDTVTVCRPAVGASTLIPQ